MEKLFSCSVIFFMITAFPVLAPGAGKDVNIPVRVFNGGKPVLHLTGPDFKIYEDSAPRAIKGFKVRKKRIDPRNTSSPFPRYFVLIFQPARYDNRLREGLAYFFANLAGEKDRLLAAINGEILVFHSLVDKEKILVQIEAMLIKQGKQAQKRIESELKEIKKFMDKIRSRSAREMARDGVGAVHLHYYMKYLRFSFDQYLKSLLEYKKNYLLPNTGTFYNLSKQMKKEEINGEKWVIHFYRLGRVPELSTRNREFIKKLIKDLGDSNLGDELYYSDIFKRLLGTIDDTFNDIGDYPAEEITKLFYNVDAVFNSIFLRDGSDGFSRDPKYRRLSTAVENNLREIAWNTGGVFTVSDRKIQPALDFIKNNEDISYLLTFTPADPGKAGKIQIEAGDKDSRVYYDDNSGAGYETPSVQVRDIALENKKLSLSIVNFLREKTGSGILGKISVRIRIIDRRDKKVRYDQDRAMLPRREAVHISIPCSWLEKGEYDIVVDSTDLLTGKTGSGTLHALVN